MESSEEANQRYLRAAHAMQTGVKFTMENDPADTTAKHLRVGVNSALVEHGALVRMLIKKGLFSEQEYMVALADAMEEEAKKYRDRLEAIHGVNVELH